MSTLFAAGLTGIALGFRHAFEPDHLAAVGGLVPRHLSARRAAAVGALWGGGHAAALLALGALALFLRVGVPELLGAFLELCVGGMLVFLGLRTVREASAVEVDGEPPARGVWRPVAVGVAHGVAGTGGAVVLASASMPKLEAGLVFLACFGVGAAGAMAMIAGLLGLPLGRAFFRRHRGWFATVLGLGSISVGIWWALGAMVGISVLLG